MVKVIEYRDRWAEWFQYIKWFIRKVSGLYETDRWLEPASYVHYGTVTDRWPIGLVGELMDSKARLARTELRRDDDERSQIVLGVGNGPKGDPMDRAALAALLVHGLLMGVFPEYPVGNVQMVVRLEQVHPGFRELYREVKHKLVLLETREIRRTPYTWRPAGAQTAQATGEASTLKA